MQNVKQVNKELEDLLIKGKDYNLYIATFNLNDMHELTELCAYYGYTYLSTSFENVVQLIRKDIVQLDNRVSTK
jgi:hypothetical protein